MGEGERQRENGSEPVDRGRYEEIREGGRGLRCWGSWLLTQSQHKSYLCTSSGQHSRYGAATESAGEPTLRMWMWKTQLCSSFALRQHGLRRQADVRRTTDSDQGLTLMTLSNNNYPSLHHFRMSSTTLVVMCKFLEREKLCAQCLWLALASRHVDEQSLTSSPVSPVSFQLTFPWIFAINSRLKQFKQLQLTT